MTYCAGILVQDGLVMIADTRTNAGLDDVSTFRKLHVFSWPGDRTFGLIDGRQPLGHAVGRQPPARGRAQSRDRRDRDAARRADSMFRAAQLVGRAIRSVRETDGPALREAGVKFDVSMLFGGQIKGQPMRLFMIYGAGNFIECGMDTPFLQIGEHKYGKPILDRAVTYKTHLYDALKVGLISMDSTMRSNLGVGLPIDLHGDAPRRRRARAEPPHRGGRALFPRSARALVGGPARRAHRDSPPALRPPPARISRGSSAALLWNTVGFGNGMSTFPRQTVVS